MQGADIDIYRFNRHIAEQSRFIQGSYAFRLSAASRFDPGLQVASGAVCGEIRQRRSA